MDKALRDELRKATQSIRGLLEKEFSEQLEGTFDILADGTVLTVPGQHLSAAQRVVREKLVAVIAHKEASGLSPAAAVGAYLREAAFTTLNRFVALKMLEARGLVQECVSRGDESGGFKEFTALAPGMVQLPDKGYRVYIETVFDEIGQEVRMLFDRRDVASLLWPRRLALTTLLERVNSNELKSVWTEDETVGWVYQYFNSDKDLDQARYDDKGKPKAPQSSYEMAVRNQFFTPRYVVQFLTDNTLGRIWYEMMQGQTKLKETCGYLIRRPTEIFLQPDEVAPEQGLPVASLTKEELLSQPSFIRFRAIKDPRDIRMLDPACGSMHFGLYAFDLFQTIYEEAWDCALETPDGMQPLHEAYNNRDEYLLDVPRLILANNIHGIDIDPRAAQIAVLSLWLRAQKSWQNQGVAPGKRPTIRRSNIVCAEAMPGEETFFNEFIEAHLSATPEMRLLSQLLGRVFLSMKFAGEAGSLLKIEEEITRAVLDAKKMWHTTPSSEQGSLFNDDSAIQAKKEFRLDVSGIADETFWEKAEERIYSALQKYAEQAEHGGGYQRRLFADDAARGFAFIDLCRKRFDCILMNPPFGDSTDNVSEILVKQAPIAKKNTYIASVVIGCHRLVNDGMLGAITDASFIHQTRYEEFRDFLLKTSGRGIGCFSAFGWGVLDSYVETAGFVLSQKSEEPAPFIDLREDGDLRSDKLRIAIKLLSDGIIDRRCSLLPTEAFRRLPKSVMTFWLPVQLLEAYRIQPSLAPTLVDARCGMSSSDNSRFYKLWWEVSPCDISREKKWVFLSNGGSPAPLFRQQVYVANYARDGLEVKARVKDLFGSESRTVINQQYYFRSGFTYGKRTESLTVQILPEGHVFSNEGQAIFPLDKDNTWPVLAYLNSTLVASLLNSIAGQHKESGYVGSLPSAPKDFLDSDFVKDAIQKNYQILAAHARSVPESQYFLWPLATVELPRQNIFNQVQAALSHDSLLFSHNFVEIDRVLERIIGFKTNDSLPWAHRTWDLSSVLFEATDNDVIKLVCHDLVGYLIGCVFGRWDVRFATGEKIPSPLPQPFDPLPICPVGQLQNGNGLPISKNEAQTLENEGKWDYPIDISWSGILVDDPGHLLDLETRIRFVLKVIWSDCADSVEDQVCDVLGVRELRNYFRQSSGFYSDHIKRYSKSRRKAPIYWQLSTVSGSYSVWLYYHRFDRDTFFQVQSLVKAKLDHEITRLNNLRQEAGPNPDSSRRKSIEELEILVQELSGMRDEVAYVAPLWNPKFDDGVIINFAPLWRLVPHNVNWQKECKDAWDSLVSGKFDWSYLAMHLWPERVVPKCRTDRSMAIAHGLDEVLWEEDDKGKWKPAPVSPTMVEALIAERSSVAVKSALQALLSAPEPRSVGRGRSTRTIDRPSSPRRWATTSSIAETEARAPATVEVDKAALDLIRHAIANVSGGVAKADVLSATGLRESDWNKAINALLARGEVTRSGEKRGTRYHASTREKTEDE